MSSEDLPIHPDFAVSDEEIEEIVESVQDENRLKAYQQLPQVKGILEQITPSSPEEDFAKYFLSGVITGLFERRNVSGEEYAAWFTTPQEVLGGVSPLTAFLQDDPTGLDSVFALASDYKALPSNWKMRFGPGFIKGLSQIGRNEDGGQERT